LVLFRGALSQGASETDIRAYFESPDIYSLVGMSGVIGGLLISFFAGQLCAKLSKTNINRDAGILCVLSVTVGILMSLDSYNILEDIALTLLTVVAVYLGANTWKKRNIHEQRE